MDATTGKPLHILMITHHRAHKTRFRSHAMAKHLVERGHQVRELCIAETRRTGFDVYDRDGVSVVETPDLLWGRGRSGWDPWNTLNRIIHVSGLRSHYDLIHCFETRPATIYPALWLRRKRQIPLLTDWVDWWGRGGLIEEVRPRWYQRTLGPVETYYEEAFRTRANGLTVISRALEERAIGLGVDPANILRIPNGTNPDDFPKLDKAACREFAGLDATIPVIGFSSLDSHLDLGFVLDVLAVLRHRFPAIKLLVTGKAGDAVMEMAATRDVASHVFLSGFVPFEELGLYLGACDAFVLPFPDTVANRGRWPNKVCDYMAAGRPFVANPVGEVAHLLNMHDIGYAAQWDVRSFAEAVTALLRDPARAAAMGARARHLAESTFSWRCRIAELEAFYRQHQQQ